MSVVMYIKPGCPYCQKARDYYNENNIAFIEYDAQNDKARRQEMLDFSGGDFDRQTAQRKFVRGDQSARAADGLVRADG